MNRTRSLVCATVLAVGAQLSAIAAEPARKPPTAPAPPSEIAPEAPAWLGLFLGDEPDGGVKVVVVADGGPAAKAGVHEGDLLISVNGRSVTDRRRLRQVLEGLKPGEKIALETLRDGKSEMRVVEAEPRVIRLRIPELAPGGSVWPGVPNENAPFPSDGDPFGAASAGATVVSIPADLRRHYGAPADAGVLVTGIAPGGRAGAAGVKVGDVVVRAGGAPLREPGDLELRLLRHGSSAALTLEILRGGKSLSVSVPAAPPARSDEARAKRLAEIEAELARLAARKKELQREVERLGSGR